LNLFSAVASATSRFYSFDGPPLLLLGRWRSWVVWSEAIPNFALTEFSEVRC
jgi:hypothetical protein